MDIRVGTFNVENLFNRYAFLDQSFPGTSYEKFVQAVDVVSIASRQGDLVPDRTTVIQRNNTALAIEEIDADILAVQEVENVYTLRNFNNMYLSDLYEEIVCIDGNDPRAIDVGLMIRKRSGLKVTGIRTHVDDPNDATKPVIRSHKAGFGYSAQNARFSRDCLEVDIEVGGKTLTFMVNHFRSQSGANRGTDRRRGQATRVAEIVADARNAGKHPVVLGDLNIDLVRRYDQSLDPLLNAGLKDAFASLPEAERWTHFFESGRSVSQLDYIMVDEALTIADPLIFRKGLSTKCKDYTGVRFPTIGPVNTEASDHCPAVVTIKL